jgi:16S rRNA (uracil1498-N3)-methyltransferase
LRRLLLPAESIREDRVLLTGEEAHYLLRVLRLAPGDRFSAVVGGEERVATITAVDGNQVTASLATEITEPADPRVEVRLFPGLPKAAKLELIIQKCTELGVSFIQPVICRRSIPRPRADDVAHKLSRWERIAKEAARQCGRSAPPRLAAPAPFSAVVEAAGSGGTGLIFALAETSDQRPAGPLLGADCREPIDVLVGPEGGFASEEVAEAVAGGFRVAGLGRRVLRAETAAIAACATIMREAGELG